MGTYEDNALRSFDIPLFIDGNEENTFRVTNKSLSDWERSNVIERLTKATEIRCQLVDVVHGTLDTKPDSPLATLMVFKFRFDTIEHARRLIRARIDIEFFAKEAGDAAPTILAIAPDERWTIVPTVDHEETSIDGKFSAGISGIPFVDAGVEVSLQKTSESFISDATTVAGGRHLGRNIDSGDHTACGWTILENKTRRTGLPDSLTIAVLVQRKANKQFHATVSLEARGNIKTKLDEMFNKIPIDDPILFNPNYVRDGYEDKVDDYGEGNVRQANESKVQNSVLIARQYGNDRLGMWKTRLDKLSDVTFRTVQSGSEKRR